jgi:hypothetical protein
VLIAHHLYLDVPRPAAKYFSKYTDPSPKYASPSLLAPQSRLCPLLVWATANPFPPPPAEAFTATG